MQGKSIEEFMHILDCAIAYGMPKLLACCECHIANDDQDKFKPVASTFLPISSMLRMAKSLHGLKRKVSVDDDDEPCDCYCCRYNRDSGDQECECYRSAVKSANRYMPCPKDFLDMAQQS